MLDFCPHKNGSPRSCGWPRRCRDTVAVLFQLGGRLDFLKVPDSAFQFCLARPIPVRCSLREIEVIHQQSWTVWVPSPFRSVREEAASFRSGSDPALQLTNRAADRLHRAVGRTEHPGSGIKAEKVLPTLFHLVCGGADGRSACCALPLKGSADHVSAHHSRFKIAVGDGPQLCRQTSAYFWSFQSTVFSLWHFQLPEGSRMRSPFSSRS